MGDTLGIFVLGYDTTIPVTMDAMVHHCRAVSRGVRHGLVVGDLPFGSYEISVGQGVASAIRLVKEGGVAVVKLEARIRTGRGNTAKGVAGDGSPRVDTPIHPRHRRLQGPGPPSSGRRLVASQGMQDGGACSLVLEAIPTEAARQVTEALRIPTIGSVPDPTATARCSSAPKCSGSSAGPGPGSPSGRRTCGTGRLGRQDLRRRGRRRAQYPDHRHSYDWAIR